MKTNIKNKLTEIQEYQERIMMTSTVDKLVNKANEAFILAIEIYNKPTIKYRVEGFSFFICNAWELMLKAYLIRTKGESSIYFKDSPNRTISLENCLKQIFTNDKTPARANLEKIIELRNTSTHFITEEYEMVYIPLFQACIFNYNAKMLKFHQVDVTKLISLNFLNLVISEKALDEHEVKAKYDGPIADKLISLNNKIEQSMESANSDYAIRIQHDHYITKNKNDATDTIAIDKNSNNKAQIIKEVQNPNDTHPYTTKKLCAVVSNRITRDSIPVKYGDAIIEKFSKYHFQLFCKYFDIKANVRWCFVHKQFNTDNYTYSIQAIDFIISELRKDCDIINTIRAKKS